MVTMDSFSITVGWVLLVVTLEAITFHIFYKKTQHICFLTEPDLPFSQYFTIGVLRVLAIIHAAFIIVVISSTYSYVW